METAQFTVFHRAEKWGKQVPEKIFDLTFKGSVHSGYDAAQVKTDIARLFSIEEPAVIEQLFCGQKVVLKQALDRKSAAEYFSKINALGGNAELVEVGRQRLSADALPLILVQEGDHPARIVRDTARDYGIDADLGEPRQGETDQSWPVSSARLQKSSKPVPQSAEQEPAPASIEPEREPGPEPEPLQAGDTLVDEPQIPETLQASPTPTNVILASSEKELRRLQLLLTQTQEKFETESAKLQHRINQFNRIADEELAKIREMGLTVEKDAIGELSRLETLEQQLEKSGDNEVSRIKEEAKRYREQARFEENKLKKLIEKASTVDSVAIDELEKAREDIGFAAETEVRRLQQLIEETRCQAEQDISALELEFRAREARKEQELASLEKQQDVMRGELEKALLESQQRQRLTQQRLEREKQELQTESRKAQLRLDEELARVENMEKNICATREQGIADTLKSEALLRQQTEEALQKLHALSRDARERQSAALAATGANVQPDVALRSR